MKTFSNNNIRAFFDLLRAGLWEKEAQLSSSDILDFKAVYQIAEEQSVVGLVAAGLGHLKDVRAPKKDVLQFVGQAFQLEQRNQAMNQFVAKLIERLREMDVDAILVKGQGIAQCYEKPLWRASGDIDLLLSDTNYEKAKQVLLPLAERVEREFESLKHLGMTMPGGFVVELHGTLHSRLSRRVDRVIDEAQRDVFFAGNVRSEEFKDSESSRVQVLLPSPDNDVIFVFTHILKHFYIEGVGLRQICDWCRLLYTYKDSLNRRLLESRIRRAGLMTEWKAFYYLATHYLGMPDTGASFMVQGSSDNRWKKKAERIMDFILMSGNFGHNREIKRSKTWMVGKIQAAWFKMRDFAKHARLFPLDSVKFFLHYLVDGIKLSAAK